MLSSTILIRHNLKSFKEIFVCSITFEFHSRSVWYGLIVILLIVWSYRMTFKLVFITGRSIKWYLRNFMLWVRAFRNLCWGWCLKLLFISCMILEFGWRFKAVIWNIFSPIYKGILFWVVIWLKGKWFIVLSIRRISVERDVSFYYWSLN